MRPMGFPLEWEWKNVAQNRNELQMGINVMGMAVAFSQSHSILRSYCFQFSAFMHVRQWLLKTKI